MRYDLPTVTINNEPAEQWIEFRDAEDLTRSTLRKLRTGMDGEAGINAKMADFTDKVLVLCCTNWQVYSASGQQLALPAQSVVKNLTDTIPLKTWLVLDAKVDEYVKVFRLPDEPDAADTSESSPTVPSNG